MRDVASFVGIGGAGPVLVGAPEQIADQLEDWIAAGVDGFNLAYATLPATFEDFVEGVVPVLQKRGRMQTSYRAGTLREKLFEGRPARLQAPHPATAEHQVQRSAVPVPSRFSQERALRQAAAMKNGPIAAATRL